MRTHPRRVDVLVLGEGFLWQNSEISNELGALVLPVGERLSFRDVSLDDLLRLGDSSTVLDLLRLDSIQLPSSILDGRAEFLLLLVVGWEG